MNSRKIALHETFIIAVGQVIGVVAMFGVFAQLGRFDLSVLWGGLAGGTMATLNFFALAVVATLAADMPFFLFKSQSLPLPKWSTREP